MTKKKTKNPYLGRWS